MKAEKAGTIISRRAMWGSFGPPKVIFSDNGPQYAARVAKTMCAQLGVTQMRGQAYRSQSNGKAESSGKVLMDELRSILCSSKKAGTLVGRYAAQSPVLAPPESGSSDRVLDP